jgi:hypothetical protein
MAHKAYKGRFSPKNPAKYNGDPMNIIWRSTWELRVMKYFHIIEINIKTNGFE